MLWSFSIIFAGEDGEEEDVGRKRSMDSMVIVGNKRK
jgi:hypothetical protein